MIEAGVPLIVVKNFLGHVSLQTTQIYTEITDLPAEERKNRRQLSVKPLVEAYFTWVRENLPKVPQKARRGKVSIIP